MHAKLPKSMEETTITEMRVGEIAYTLPWAMWADTSRRMWLRADHSVTAQKAGTSCMEIERLRDGFRVRAVPGHRYEPCDGHTGDSLPVVKLVTS